MSTERVLSCAPPSPCGKYDVFLSFRGEDTRKNFTDHLYTALKHKGINVFKDDNKLERGKSISSEIFKAIEESRCSIIVFSRNYADSTWCLDEIVKILECNIKSISQHFIFPIFYDVQPTVVRKQTANFQQAFAKHEEALQQNMKKVQEWRHALKEVANISGWELKDRNESEFIEDIVKDVSSKLFLTKFENHKSLVGVISRLEKLRLLLGTESSGVRMIGICGMGGLGKTTIARVIFDDICGKFEGSSFLADVREISEKGNLISLQKQLLSDLLKLEDSNIWNRYEGINMISSRMRRKKVLLVIDDVVDVMQLESLVGKHCWFGSGSRIIITSRDKHLLMIHGVDEVYELTGLNDDESLQLFCMKAFKSHKPLKEYQYLSNCFAKYACGLPLGLEILGSFLYGRTVEEWESAFQILKRDPTNQIMKILEISFNGLQETEKKVFLDIACFFKGEDRDYVTKILEGCDFDATIGIPVLIEKSLISISDHNRVWVHDLLQEMGQLIVKRESNEPGKHSRLWEGKIIRHVLSENKGTEIIEGIMFNNWEHDEAYSGAKANSFSKMTNLRLLRIRNVKLLEGLEYLSNELRLLEWHGYSLESLPSNFQPDKIVELSMRYSNIKQMLNTIKPLINLKFMRFEYCQNLIRTPNFTAVPNLEELILIGCTRLREIHQSLLVHKKLEVLNLKDCTSLTTLPSKVCMGSLKKFVLSGCSKLKKFPEIVESMECLSELLLDGTSIKELPLSVNLLYGLVLLNLKDCKNLLSLPSSVINGLKRLQTLNLSGCWRLRNYPEIGTRMECLSNLRLDGTGIEELPSSVELLSGLAFLDLSDCKSLVRLPGTINGLKRLQTLNLSGCWRLRNFPEIGTRMERLSNLCLDGTGIEELPSSVELLSGLAFLDLSDCRSLVRLPGTINGLKILKTLNLSGCSKLENVPENLGEVESLEKLDISGTAIIKPVSSIFLLKNLKSLSFRGCKASAASTSWFSLLPINLMPRRSSDLMGLVLPSLSGLSSLIKLDLSDCNLGEGAIPYDICNLLSLKELYLRRNNFVSLPATINRLSKLGLLNLEGCKRLRSLLELPCHVNRIRVDGCISLERLSYALNTLYSEYHGFSCVNCLKLLGNKNLPSSMLKEYLEGRTGSNRRTSFSIVVPGSKIPEWLKYQNEGSTITIIRPPDSSYKNNSKNNLVGYAICSIFLVHKHQPAVRGLVDGGTHRLICHMKADKRETPTRPFVYLNSELGQAVSEHIWLRYVSNETLAEWFWNFEADHVELSFRPEFDRGLEVKRCGVHPIYVNEVKEFQKTTQEWVTSKVWSINESHQVFVKSTMDVPTTSKRSLTEYAEANAANEDSQLKRFKKSNN